MKEYRGQGVSCGICVGRAAVWHKKRTYSAVSDVSQSPQQAWDAFLAARKTAAAQLDVLCRESGSTLGEESAAIFEVQGMMVMDEDFALLVRTAIFGQHCDTADAIGRAAEKTAATFEGMQDEYLRARAADVRDIADRLLRCLAGEGEDSPTLPPYPCILCADELTPAQTAHLDRSRVLGFVTAHGSDTSHTAILSRTLGIPAVVGVGEDAIRAIGEGETVALDAARGWLCVSPDEKTLQAMEERRQSDEAAQHQREKFRGKPTRTKRGRRLLLYANAALPEDVEAVLAGDAEGIGLFRSEFLYLGRKEPPDEEEQYRVYTNVLERMAGRRVIIRTLDIGGDKQAECLHMEHEENPALGCRAVRHSLLHPSIFLTQARALLRAGERGRLSVMFPLISSVKELRDVLTLWEQARRQVRTEVSVELGIMIETPAAALVSDELAKMVDFFSIGTNDLTQYTLAMDRQNEHLRPFWQPHHPALLSLIRTTVDNAKRAGIWVGICGELGADLSLTEQFVRMGVDELSVAPSHILALREKISEIE